MSKNKKFAIRVSEKRTGWTAEITRQVTSRKTVVSKREAGFESEELAQAWAEKELLGFVKNQAERNERKGQQRVERNERQERLEREAAERKAAFLQARSEANDAADEDFDDYED
ncbi:DUF3622 domain-containing protein [Vibrio scophthalmi]|mgnify:CR=1 FL=1|uniref:DUF3622 domain-containing protein n=2 Tax=Vibrio scophthalmi TaxID=45658 RepID=A0A1B1NQW1_9VIBR|nr:MULTISPECIES: DUF3622 domain-containing protein [Vibrio]ANS86159.1 hypothetical protein VSVS12_02399 [Vibrio scophthalmi]ANU35709.1 hypothetical protein VSVS05_00576 [Vibrio scophthalmi]EGU30382.1 hypothetical protein VIS19158_20092 [Vibrio scophthalmi LMG 19158]EGU37218.1 hypothetical protein VIBRN418_13876 [Vibrio sp. N418]MCY9805787.1 DUF3622 domain-containing protein [Vibrio scophthalmi]